MSGHELNVQLPKPIRDVYFRSSRVAREEDIQEARHQVAVERAQNEMIAKYKLNPGDVNELYEMMDKDPKLDREFLDLAFS